MESTEKNVNFGICRFCGATVMINPDHAVTSEEANELATLSCDCNKAVIYQNAINLELNALMQMDALFDPDGNLGKDGYAIREKTRDILREGIHCLIFEGMNSIQIKTNEMNVSAKKSSTGKIKIGYKISKGENVEI